MEDAPAFRIWPPVAISVPWLAGLWLDAAVGEPVSLDGGWATAVGWVLVAAFAVWNGWALVLMARHETALLPGGSTRVVLDCGPFAVSRNPLYVGLLVLAAGVALLAGSFWALVSVPVGCALVWWGAVRPEERYLARKFGPAYDDYRRRVRRWL